MQNDKITYLIGAGASCGALPLVKDFRGASNQGLEWTSPFEQMISELQNISGALPPFEFHHNSFKSVASELITDLKWLSTQCKQHATVDTYAKKLYLTRKNHTSAQNLKRLKFTLSAYFAWIQCVRQPDERYDTFFASIANSGDDMKLKLPENLKIISWNYDLQFEKSFSQYYDNSDLSDVQSSEGLNCFPSLKYSHSDNEYKSKNFSIIKLNGTAGLHRSGGKNSENNVLDRLWYSNNHNDKKDLINQILSMVSLYKNRNLNVNSLLSFAWERDSNDGVYKHHDTLAEAQKIALDTDILVVIGYSFPFFNRKVDKELFSSLLVPKGRLRKIYYQVPHYDSAVSKQTLETILGDKLEVGKLVMITETRDFYIPPEFTL